MQFTYEEKRAEADREVAMRKAVYSRHGALSAADLRRIKLMEEIRDDYARLAQGERLL